MEVRRRFKGNGAEIRSSILVEVVRFVNFEYIFIRILESCWVEEEEGINLIEYLNYKIREIKNYLIFEKYLYYEIKFY